jgi:hypothetical protein
VTLAGRVTQKQSACAGRACHTEIFCWRLGLSECVGRFREDQEQAERVLAGKLAAGATALGDELVQIDARLVGRLAAALDLTPRGPIRPAERLPLGRSRESLSSLGRACVWGHVQHALCRHRYRHESLRKSTPAERVSSVRTPRSVSASRFVSTIPPGDRGDWRGLHQISWMG